MRTKKDCAGCFCWRRNDDDTGFSCTGSENKSCLRNNKAAQINIFGDLLDRENEKHRPSIGSA